MVNGDTICGNKFLLAFNGTVIKVETVSRVLRAELNSVAQAAWAEKLKLSKRSDKVI